MKRTSRHPREPEHQRKAADHRPSGATAAEGAFHQSDTEATDARPFAFLELDRAGRIRKLNQEGARLLGFSPDWLRGKSFVVFVARQDTDRFIKFLLESVHTSTTRVIDLDMHVGHRTVAVQLSLKTAVTEESISHYITITDHLDAGDIDLPSKEALANWQSLVHNAPDTLMAVTDQGRICFVNKPLWGYSVRALIGTNIVDLVPEDERPTLQKCLDRGFHFKRGTSCEMTGIEGQNGAWFLFTVRAPDESIRDRYHPELRTTTVAIRDISEAKRVADTLRDSREQLSDFAGRLESAREAERVRLARELQDELGQALTGVKIELQMIESNVVAGDIRKAVRTLTTHVDEILDRVKDLSLELQPAIMLSELGLLAAIKWQVAEFEKATGIPAAVVCTAESLRLPSDVSIAAYRVIQEAFTNVMRHADASLVRVYVHLIGDGLRVSIVDNGKGMTPAQESGLKSIGIVGMKERVARLRGDLSITSAPGKGTKVAFFIPTHVNQLGLPFQPVR
jgi:PAS domain S-box-containing protein